MTNFMMTSVSKYVNWYLYLYKKLLYTILYQIVKIMLSFPNNNTKIQSILFDVLLKGVLLIEMW